MHPVNLMAGSRSNLRCLAVLDAVRQQFSDIEAALPDYGTSCSAPEQQPQQIQAQLDRIAASLTVRLSAEQRASLAARKISVMLPPLLAKL
jgi:hypothetical protein